MAEKKTWLVDLHNHDSDYSDGIFPLREQIKRARAAGVDIMSVANHDRFIPEEEMKKLTAEDLGLVFLNGIEVTAFPGHIGAVFPMGTPKKEIPMFLSLKLTTEILRAEGAVIYIPHFDVGPTFDGFGGSVDWRALDELYQQGGWVDAIETMNPVYDLYHQKRAEEAARIYGIAQIAGGDDHVGNIGRTVLSRIDIVTGNPISDLIIALEEGAITPIESGNQLLGVPLWERVKRQPRSLVLGLENKIKSSPNIVRTWYEQRSLRRTFKTVCSSN